MTADSVILYKFSLYTFTNALCVGYVCIFLCTVGLYFDSKQCLGDISARTLKSWVKGQIFPVLSTYNA